MSFPAKKGVFSVKRKRHNGSTRIIVYAFIILVILTGSCAFGVTKISERYADQSSQEESGDQTVSKEYGEESLPNEPLQPAMVPINEEDIENTEVEDDKADPVESIMDEFPFVSNDSEEYDQEEADGRVLFVGDSRTIDMFEDSDNSFGPRIYDGIIVYGGHGRKIDFLKASVKDTGLDNFDTLVSWMGANDNGRFAPYGEYYDSLLEQNKKLVICTVGPTDNSSLSESDSESYQNDTMLTFNDELLDWAKQHEEVKIIDLYDYIENSPTVYIDPEDGIHYLPRPTEELWDYIRNNI